MSAKRTRRYRVDNLVCCFSVTQCARGGWRYLGTWGWFVACGEESIGKGAVLLRILSVSDEIGEEEHVVPVGKLVGDVLLAL